MKKSFHWECFMCFGVFSPTLVCFKGKWVPMAVALYLLPA